MQNLASTHIKDDCLKTIFLKGIFNHITVLASSSDSLDNLAVLDDKMYLFILTL